jgi:large subunit ribosomal protein L5
MTSLQLDTNKYIKLLEEKIIADSNKKINRFSYGIEKIVINVGVGKLETKQIDDVFKNLIKLVAQKPKKIQSKKSVAGFKLRAGQTVGIQATLRGEKMYSFLLQLIYLALPRTRDFKGLSKNSFDKSGKTYSIGIKSASIFPVIGFDSGVDFGIQINIVFKNSIPENYKLLETINIPFQR